MGAVVQSCGGGGAAGSFPASFFSRSTASGKRWVEFRVTDHGEGLSSEVAARLFTPFFTTKAEGMGLGLSLCRTVIEQHGGALDHSPAEPRGTVFRFTLPIATGAAMSDGEGRRMIATP